MTRVYQVIGNFPWDTFRHRSHEARVSDRSTASHRREAQNARVSHGEETPRVWGQTQSSLPAGVPVNLRRSKVASPRLRSPFPHHIVSTYGTALLNTPLIELWRGSLNDFSQKQKLEARVRERLVWNLLVPRPSVCWVSYLGRAAGNSVALAVAAVSWPTFSSAKKESDW